MLCFVTFGDAFPHPLNHFRLDPCLGLRRNRDGLGEGAFANAILQDRVAEAGTPQHFRATKADDATALRELAARLAEMPAGSTAEEIQALLYEIGKGPSFESVGAWFQTLYECLLGQPRGPRMGTFIDILGIPKMVELIESRLADAQGDDA